MNWTNHSSLLWAYRLWTGNYRYWKYEGCLFAGMISGGYLMVIGRGF